MGDLLEITQELSGAYPVQPFRDNAERDAMASAVGCYAIEATDQELFLDLDSEEAHDHFLEFWPDFCGIFGTDGDYKESWSRSGSPKRHITVILPVPVPLVQRIAFQAILGSDPKREMLAMSRAQKTEKNVVLFFEPIKKEKNSD